MIDFQGVSVSFNNEPVLRDITIHIHPGEFLSVVGESGVGKTTLLRLIYFDLIPDSGTVNVGDFASASIRKRDIPKVRRLLGVVFQDYKLLEDRNVFDNVAFPMEVTGVEREEINSRTLRVLADIGLSHKRSQMPSELSGGEQQRVVIARAIVNKPDALLADEPTANLDHAAATDILRLLQQINAQGTSVILATHDFDLARTTGGRIARLQDGMLTENRTS